MRTMLIIAAGLLINTLQLAAVTARIAVEPSTTVTVGEEVLFHAAASDGRSETDSFRWDFGDGYTLTKGAPYYYTDDSGLACSHFFMKPGSYKVKLNINDGASTAEVTMTVTGEEAIEGFELWHADYHARIAQYIYAQIPENIRSSSTNKLKVTLTSDKGYNAVLFDKADLAAEEVFLLRNSDLPVGNYTLEAKLESGSGSRLSVIREKFSRDYTGIPTVGIDENNAIRVNGELFYPVTPWILDIGKTITWRNGGYINSLYGIGWIQSGISDLSAWQTYLKATRNLGWRTVGPVGWDDKGPKHYERNADVSTMADYVTNTRDHDGLLMWMWDDEPDIGGYDQYVPSPVIRAWTKKSHDLDQQHPVATNFTGPYYTRTAWSEGRAKLFQFMYNEEMFGKRTPVVDVYGADYYPYDWDWASMSNLALMLDRMRDWNHNLVPYMSFIETSDIKDSDGTPPPTAAELHHIIWLTVIHGAKGINWFQYFTQTSEENYQVMADFVTDIDRLKGVVLGPEPERTVTDDCNTAGKRVDVMVRESGDTLYVFTARLTEPEESDDAPFNCTFTIPGVTGGTAHVLKENRSVSVSGGKLTDSFASNDVHIYAIPGVPTGITSQKFVRPENLSGTGGLLKAGSAVLYTMDGAEVFRGTARSLAVQNIPAGVYLVKTSGGLQKIIIAD